MRWSKLRRLVLDRFAPELRGRLDLQSAAYGNCSCGHAWMTWDGRVIANFCTRAHYISLGMEGTGSPPTPKYLEQVAAFGEWSRQDAYQSCWAFVHELSIEQALAHEDALVRALAIADARVGRRRLAMIGEKAAHPLGRLMLALRSEPDSPLAIADVREAA